MTQQYVTPHHAPIYTHHAKNHTAQHTRTPHPTPHATLRPSYTATKLPHSSTPSLPLRVVRGDLCGRPRESANPSHLHSADDVAYHRSNRTGRHRLTRPVLLPTPAVNAWLAIGGECTPLLPLLAEYHETFHGCCSSLRTKVSVWRMLAGSQRVPTLTE